MYAIVEIAGQQFKVEEGKKIFVHRLEAESGNKVEFDQVLLIEDKGKVVIGEPVIKDALVEGKVLDQLRGDKIIVFKKKRKKGFRIRNGHRQYFTQVEIVSIKEKTTRKISKKEEVTVPEATEGKVATEHAVPEKKTTAGKTVKSEVKEKSGKGSGKKGAVEEPAVKKMVTKKSPKRETKK